MLLISLSLSFPPFLSTSYIGKTLFEDTMTYNDEGALVLVKKNEKDGMEITAIRSLEEGGKVLVMVSGRGGGREGGRQGYRQGHRQD